MKCGNSARSTKDNQGAPTTSFQSIRQPVFPAADGAPNGVDGGGTLNLAENGQQCARGVAANFTAHRKSRD